MPSKTRDVEDGVLSVQDKNCHVWTEHRVGYCDTGKAQEPLEKKRDMEICAFEEQKQYRFPRKLFEMGGTASESKPSSLMSYQSLTGAAVIVNVKKVMMETTLPSPPVLTKYLPMYAHLLLKVESKGYRYRM